MFKNFTLFLCFALFALCPVVVFAYDINEQIDKMRKVLQKQEGQIQPSYEGQRALEAMQEHLDEVEQQVEEARKAQIEEARKATEERSRILQEELNKKTENTVVISEEAPKEDNILKIYHRKGKNKQITFTNGSVVDVDSFWEENGFFVYEIYGAVVKVDKHSVKEIK